MVTFSAIVEWTPTFFVQGQGGTLLRQLVLGSAITMFAATAAVLASANRRSPSAFTYWYGLALALIAVGLLGVMMEPSHGCPLSWAGRAAQFLGGAYMLIAAVASVRETRAWGIPLEETLYRRPAFVSEVLKTVRALVAVLDREGRIVSFNRACEEASGYSLAEVKGKYVWDLLLSAEEVEPAQAVFAQLRAGQFPNAHEDYWVAKDGARRLIYWTDSCLTDSSGAVQYVIGTGIEVTDRRRAEEALRANEARFRALVQNSSDIITLFDGEGTVLYQSPSIEPLLGYRPEGRTGQNVFHNPIVHPDDLAAKRAFFETARSRHGTPVTAEFRLRHADDSWRDIEAVGQSFVHHQGVAGIVANYRDVTDRKRAEEALRQQAQLLHLSYDAILVWRKDGGIERWNRGAEQLYGFTEGEALGRITHELLKTIHPAPWPEIEAAMRKHGHWEGELRHFAKDGREVIVSARHQLVVGSDGIERILETNRDVTDRKRAEESLRESEERYRTLFESSRDGIIFTDMEGRILRANPYYRETLGYSEEELRALTYQQLTPQCWQEKEAAIVRDKIMSRGYSGEYEKEYIRRDGTVFPISIQVWLVRDGHGEPQGMWGIVRDITERKRAEEALRESEEKYRTIVETATEAIAIVDAEARIAFVNDHWSEMFGYSREEALHMTHFDLLFPEDMARQKERWESCQGGRKESYEVRLRRKDGNPVWVLVGITPNFGPGGEFLGTLNMLADITERKRAEEALRASQQSLALAQAIAHFGNWSWDIKTNEQQWSDESFRIFGFEPGECQPDYDLYLGLSHPDDRGRLLACWRDVLERNASFNIDYRIIRRDGSIRHIHSEGQIVRDDEGQPSRVFGINQDITERRRAEEALRQEKESYRTLAENLPGLVYRLHLGEQRRMEFFNQSLVALTGYAETELTMGELCLIDPLIVAEDHDAAVKGVHRAIREHHPFAVVFRLRTKAGEVRHFRGRGQPVYAPDGVCLHVDGVIFDITERREAEEALRESEKKFRVLAETSPAAILIYQGGKYVYVNPAAESITGYTRAALLAQGPGDIVQPDYREQVRQMITRREQGEDAPAHYELKIDTKDGQRRWMDCGTVSIKYGNKPAGLVVAFDITERKRAEEAMAAARTAAEAATEAKSRFLASMSHELRTPMNAILGMIDVALPKATDPAVRDCLETAKGSADLLLALLNDLLDSARIEAGRLELESVPFSLRQVLDQLRRVLAVRASQKGLAFYCRVPNETPDAVVGDRMRLQQILLNLGGNAIKFTERGDVEISLRTLSQQREACLEFAVRDTGIGISPSGLERLFQPFGQANASMSRRFGGTGLGLSISKSLVEMMGGRISVESEVGKGSTFTFTVRLPLAKELPPDVEAPAVLPTAACDQLRVLLVEDNHANRKLAAYILQDRGHVVEIAEDGQEALCLAERNRYDVILMDVQMPGMDGLEATAAIRKREGGGSHVPIIAMTAHAMKSDREHCLAAGMDGYLSKPLDAREMIGLVEGLACGRAGVGEDARTRPASPEAPPARPATVFDPDEALARCHRSDKMLRQMIEYFFQEVDELFPQMRAALQQGDLAEVGRQGHRMKGTVAYLGARPALDAALAVERFSLDDSGDPAEAREAVSALERECQTLVNAIKGHPLAAKPTQED